MLVHIFLTTEGILNGDYTYKLRASAFSHALYSQLICQKKI